MAGDITKQLTTEVRTLLDESTESFFKDTEIYTALTDAQREYVSIILSQYKAKSIIDPSINIPQVLQSLATSSLSDVLFVGDTYSNGLPSDYLYFIMFYLKTDSSDTLTPCPIRDYSIKTVAASQNSYLNARMAWVDSTLIHWTPAAKSGGQITLDYIKQPPDMTGSVDPLIPSFCYPALVKYALAEMMKKDNLDQEAAQNYQEFLSKVKYI